MTDELVTLELRNDVAELGRLGDFLDAFSERHGLHPKVAYGVNLVLDELVTNVISYGHPGGGEHLITLRMAMRDGELTAELEDDGRPFNPLGRPEPDTTLSIEERPIGGLGIHFARKTMDDIQYQRRGDRNILTMKKRVLAP